jgi:hypothetical protein
MSFFLELMKKNPLLHQAYHSADPDRLSEDGYFDEVFSSVVSGGVEVSTSVPPPTSDASMFVATRQLITLLVDRTAFYKYSSDSILDKWIALWEIPLRHFIVDKKVYYFNGRRFLPTGEKCVPVKIVFANYGDPRVKVVSLESFIASSLASMDIAVQDADDEPEYESWFSSTTPSPYVLNIREVNRAWGMSEYQVPFVPGFPSADTGLPSTQKTKSSSSQGFQSAFSTVRSSAPTSSSSKAGSSNRGQPQSRKPGVVPKVSSVERRKKDNSRSVSKSGVHMCAGHSTSSSKVSSPPRSKAARVHDESQGFRSHSPVYVPGNSGFPPFFDQDDESCFVPSSPEYAPRYSPPGSSRKKSTSE